MSSPLERLRHHVTGAIERGEVKPIVGYPSLSLDFKGWHVWQNTQGRVLANGPDEGNRLLEFADPDEAINWLFVAGYRELARAIQAAVKPKE